MEDLKRFVSKFREQGLVEHKPRNSLEIRSCEPVARNHAFFWKRRARLTSVKERSGQCQMNETPQFGKILAAPDSSELVEIAR